MVDDAIVVVEAVQHQLEQGFPPREATIRAMEQVTGPIIAVGVVLSFVFFPCVFFSGIVGAFFKQFALTIAVSTLISTFNSLTLSPALCALSARGPTRPPRTARLGSGGDRSGTLARLRTSAGCSTAAFAATGRGYVKVVGLGLRVPLFVLAGYFAIVGAGVAELQTMPTGFIPQQDKGYLVCSIQLPDAASAKRTERVHFQDHRMLHWTWRWTMAMANRVHPVKHVNAIAGNSFVLSAYGSNFGSMFIILDGFDKLRFAQAISRCRLRRSYARSSRRPCPGRS